MTNVLYNSTWPTNQQQQQEYIRRLEKLVAQLEARKKPIVFRSKAPPTQADWETAWVVKTGLNLPIPPGTKLVWYDVTKSMMFTYTVPFDLLGGLASSGQVVRNIDQSYDRPPMRLLAYYDSAEFLPWYNPQTNLISTVHEPTIAYMFRGPIPLNPYVLQAKGLHDIIIIYRLRFNVAVAAGSSSWDLAFSTVSNDWDQFGSANQQAGYVTLEQVNGTLTRTDGGSSGGAMNLGGRSTYEINAPSNAYSAGVLQMTHLTLADDAGGLTQDRTMFQGHHFGTRIDDALTTGKFGFNIGAYYHWGQYPAKNLGPRINHTYPNIGKAWIYGLFSKNTQEMVDGQYL